MLAMDHLWDERGRERVGECVEKVNEYANDWYIGGEVKLKTRIYI